MCKNHIKMQYSYEDLLSFNLDCLLIDPILKHMLYKECKTFSVLNIIQSKLTFISPSIPRKEYSSLFLLD